MKPVSEQLENHMDETLAAFYASHPIADEARQKIEDHSFRCGEENTLPAEQRAIRGAIRYELLHAQRWFHSLQDAQETMEMARAELDKGAAAMKRLCAALDRMKAEERAA